MKCLTKKQILFLHKELIKNFGGIEGIRDENLLDSAVAAPFQTFGGKDLFPTLLEKAARLGYGIVKNHPFLDGNKRIGTHSMLTFLKANGISVNYNDQELIDVILKISDNTLSADNLLNWLIEHSNF